MRVLLLVLILGVLTVTSGSRVYHPRHLKTQQPSNTSSPTSSSTSSHHNYIFPSYEILHQYIQKHSADVIRHESNVTLCNRRFIPAYAACELSGNEILEFVDNALWAIALNRTLILTHNSCIRTVEPRHWIMRHDELIDLLKQANCGPPDLISYALFVDGKIEQSLGNDTNVVRCCNISNINTLPIQYIGKNQNIPLQFMSPSSIVGRENHKYAWELLHPKYGKNTLLTRSGQRNINTIFGIDERHVKESYIDKIQSFRSYGHVFFLLTQLNEKAKNLIKPILSTIYEEEILTDMMVGRDSTDNDTEVRGYQVLNTRLPTKAVVFGIHVRHSGMFEGNETIEKQQDICQYKCFKHRVQDILIRLSKQYHRKIIPCVILLGTDRNHSIDSATIMAKQLNCTLQYVPKNRRADVPSYEYGPWGYSYMATADAYLLSHAHYFMGNKESAFSMAIANMVAARHDIAKYWYEYDELHKETSENKKKKQKDETDADKEGDENTEKDDLKDKKKKNNKNKNNKNNKNKDKDHEKEHQQQRRHLRSTSDSTSSSSNKKAKDLIFIPYDLSSANNNESYLWAMSDTCVYKGKNEKEEDYCSDWIDLPSPRHPITCSSREYADVRYDLNASACIHTSSRKYHQI